MTASPGDTDQTRQLSVEIIARGSTASIVLHGEADMASFECLEAALSGFELNGEASVDLQVADLRFCDVPSMRQLTLFARQVTQAGRVVTTSGAAPIVHKLARLMNVERDLGLF